MDVCHELFIDFKISFRLGEEEEATGERETILEIYAFRNLGRGIFWERPKEKQASSMEAEKDKDIKRKAKIKYKINDRFQPLDAA